MHQKAKEQNQKANHEVLHLPVRRRLKRRPKRRQKAKEQNQKANHEEKNEHKKVLKQENKNEQQKEKVLRLRLLLVAVAAVAAAAIVHRRPKKQQTQIVA